jgi:hypothetical protein
MKFIYYPSKRRISIAQAHDDPLVVLIGHDGDKSIVGPIDDVMEHHILLKKAGFQERDIYRYFRVIVNASGASWTFVCPSTYLDIRDRSRRLTKYFENGIVEIAKALKLLGYDVPIDIPARYRRHFNELKE